MACLVPSTMPACSTGFLGLRKGKGGTRGKDEPYAMSEALGSRLLLITCRCRVNGALMQAQARPSWQKQRHIHNNPIVHGRTNHQECLCILHDLLLM